MEGSVFVTFCSTDPPEVAEVVQSALNVCADHGLSKDYASETPVDPDEASLNESGNIVLYSGKNGMRFMFGQDQWQEPAGPILNITVEGELISPDDTDTDSEYRGFTRTFVELIRDLAVEIDPVLVSTFNTHHDGEIAPSPETVIPLETPIESDLERIPWLGIYSDSSLQQFGGRDRVLDTPAWKVEELDNGSILIITTKVPWEDYTTKQPVDRYLLDGEEPPF